MNKFCKLEDILRECNENEMYKDCFINIDLKRAPSDLMKVDPNLSQNDVRDLFKEKVELVHHLLLRYDMVQRVYWVSPA